MLDGVLAKEINIRVRKLPFPHIVVDKLFNKHFYKVMCEEFDKRLKKGLSDKFAKDKFWKFGHYDAWCWTFNPKTDQVFSDVFYSLEWRQWVNKFFNMKLTKNMLAEFHYHKPNSASGYIHSDYDLASFKWEPLPNGVNPHMHQVAYRGRSKGADKYAVRNIAMLYYFNNPSWHEGDGGETALFDRCEDGSEPVQKVAPLNNRLLAFQISPISHHTFLTNKKNVRNTMVMWFHAKEEYVTELYGKAP